MKPVPKPTRDLTDEEFRVLSSPKVVEAITERTLELETQGLDREAAMDRALFEAEEELLRQRAARGLPSPESAPEFVPVRLGPIRTIVPVQPPKSPPSKPKAFGATLGEMLANRGKK